MTKSKLLLSMGLALALILRALTAVQALITEGQIRFLFVDSYYQLRRLYYFLHNFPRVLTEDGISFLQPDAVDWPWGFVWIFGLPLRILQLDSFMAMEWGVTLMVIFLGLLSLYFIYRVILMLTGSQTLALVGLLVGSLNYSLIQASCFGSFDHHVLEALIPLCFLYFSILWFQKGERIFLWAAVLSLIIGLTISASLLFALIPAILLFGFHCNKNEWRDLGSSFLVAFLLAVLIFAINWLLYRELWSMKHLSLFHLILIAAASVASIAFVRWKILFPIFVGLSGAGMFVFINDLVPGSFGALMRDSLHYVFRGGLGSNISEMLSPLVDDQGALDFQFVNHRLGYFWFFILLSPLVYGYLVWKKAAPRAVSFSVGMLAFTSIIFITQSRFIFLIVPFFLIAFFSTLSLLSIQGLRSSQRRMAFVLVIFLFLFPSLRGGILPVREGDYVDEYRAVSELAEHLNLSPELRALRLSCIDCQSPLIWAKTDLGHQIQYRTGLSPVSNAFHRYEGLQLDKELRASPNITELQLKLDKHRIEYALYKGVVENKRAWTLLQQVSSAWMLYELGGE